MIARTIEALESRLHLSIAPVPRPSYNSGTGFFVTGGKVYDANGYEFIIKGVNHNQWWGNATNNLNAIDHVARTGANAVRAVFHWSDPHSGSNTPAERRTIVERYLANNIVPVVEDHAATTPALHQDPAALAQIVDQWLDPGNVSWLQQYESKIILNIANEWGPNSTVWRDAYITQVARLRNAGINALIMIDAGGWGQEINTIKSWGQAVLNADPQRNIVFSIHFYSQWRTEDRSFDVGGSTYDVRTELMAVQAMGLPIVVGEFSWEGHENSPHRTRRVMEICNELGIGYMGWAWSENTPSTLNMLPGSNWQYNSNADLTIWGDQIINDPDYGIKATAVRATVFPADPLRFVLERTAVSVPETGTAAVHVRLSSPPTTNLSVTVSKLSGGDASLTLAGPSSLLFTPANWNRYQPVVLSASADGDALNGTARFQVSAPGVFSADFLAKENDTQLTLGAGTETPIADRDSSSGTAATSNVTSSNALTMKFSLAAWGGRPQSAILRVYKNTVTSGRIARAWFSYDDAWTETSYVPYRAFPVASLVMPNGVGYVDFDVTSLMTAEMLRDGVLTVAITTNSNSATSFFTRESATNRPALVINTVEAIPPAPPVPSFQPEYSPNQLWFRFFEDVSASLSADDAELRSLTNPGGAFGIQSVSWDAPTQTGVFRTSPAVLPDGWYEMRLKRQGVTDSNGNPLVADAVHVFPFLLGDIANSDRRIDIADFSVLASHFNQPAGLYQGDLNYDGSAGIADFAIMAGKFNTSLPVLRSPGLLLPVDNRDWFEQGGSGSLTDVLG